MDVKQSWSMAAIMIAMTGGNVYYTGSRATDPAEITANIEEKVTALTHSVDKLIDNGSDGVRELQVQVESLHDQILVLDIRGSQWVIKKLDSIEDSLNDRIISPQWLGCEALPTSAVPLHARGGDRT